MRDNLIYLVVAGAFLCLSYFFYLSPDVKPERADVTIRIFLIAMTVAGILYGSISMHKAEVRKARFWAILLAMLGCYAFFQWHLIASKKSEHLLLITLLEVFLFWLVLGFLLRLFRRQSTD